jgi:hypothetical protein
VTFESGTTSSQIRSGTRADGTHAYYFTINDDASTPYSHEVRFHGVNNCAGKQATALADDVTDWGDPITGIGYAFADRTVTLDAACNTSTVETWAPRGHRVYRVAIQ